MFQFNAVGKNCFVKPHSHQHQHCNNPQSQYPLLEYGKETSPLMMMATQPPHGTVPDRDCGLSGKENALWSGDFKTRNFNVSPLIFSNKMFIGGIPPNMSKDAILSLLQKFDLNLSVQWPELNMNSKTTPPYLRIVMSSNENVSKLLENCEFVVEGGCETFNYEIFYKSKRRNLQIVPWLSTDSNFKRSHVVMSQLPTKFTVFVGALHGRMHAEAIANIFDDVFGDVTSVRIDTDQHDYPTGSGRVTFGNASSFKKAVLSNFIQIDSKKVKKRIQIEPCIDGQSCCLCLEENVPNFCKKLECFDYYCNPCWLIRHHPANGEVLDHSPIRRKSKTL